MKLSAALSQRAFEVTRDEEVADWIRAIDRELGGVAWVPVGGIDNNVHTVEVASDPALALVERPTNSIDAILELRARQRGETAPTPHDAAKKWFDVPSDGLSAMDDKARRALADLIQVTLHESGSAERPTITIQDQGMGQHPDDFPDTLLSLLASNKKRLTHVMGVYNAGGAASYKFAKWTIMASRLAPSLLGRRTDEVGMSIVRYNPLDAERYKSGVYEYLVDREKNIIRLDVTALPNLPHGAYVKLVEYLIPKYAKGAHQPKQSLWHLFHAALPNPALPFRIIETRSDRFAGMKGIERRVVTGLRHLLTREGTADYREERPISLGSDGSVVLHYFVINDGGDPDAYTTSEQGLTLTLNGQRQSTKDRLWLRRQLNLYYLYKRLIVFLDGTGLTSAAKRELFASTRETSVDTPLMKKILDRVVQELKNDEGLAELDELARQKTLQDATRSTTEKVKRELASRIGAFLKGQFGGNQGGEEEKKKRKKNKRKRRKLTGKPPATDDSMMLDVPDKLTIVTNPLKIDQGETEALRLEINAKNGFLPRYAENLSIIIGPELKDHVKVVSTGRLLGGRVRVTIEAAADAPVVSTSLRVALVVPDLGVLLTGDGVIEVTEAEEEEEDERRQGGAPNVDISWVGREKWDSFPVPWDEHTGGECLVYKDDPKNPDTITKVVWTLNEAFAPWERTVAAKKLSESALKTFRERYEVPVAINFFHQALAEQELEATADEHGKPYDIPESYARRERTRLARAVLMALEPDVHVHEAGDVGGD